MHFFWSLSFSLCNFHRREIWGLKPCVHVAIEQLLSQYGLLRQGRCAGTAKPCARSEKSADHSCEQPAFHPLTTDARVAWWLTPASVSAPCCAHCTPAQAHLLTPSTVQHCSVLEVEIQCDFSWIRLLQRYQRGVKLYCVCEFRLLVVTWDLRIFSSKQFVL